MPPELYSQIRADYRVDIWSLGITFYEVASGKHPFHIDEEDLPDDQTKMKTRALVLSTDIPPLSSRFFQVSHDFSQLIGHMMEKTKQARPLVQEVLDSKLIQNVLVKGITKFYF